jgi:hypothetical protein
MLFDKGMQGPISLLGNDPTLHLLSVGHLRRTRTRDLETHVAYRKRIGRELKEL